MHDIREACAETQVTIYRAALADLLRVVGKLADQCGYTDGQMSRCDAVARAKEMMK